jgi:hypothetical protein
MSPALSQTAARPRIRPPATTARGSPYGAPASLLLHGLAVAALLFTFRSFVPPEESSTVPVDLVTIAEDTNIAAAAPPEPQQQETFERPPLEALPPPPVPDIAEPAPVEVKPPEIKIEQPRPDTRQDISRLLDQLTKAEPAPRKNARTAPQASEAVGLGNAATVSLAEAMRNAIRRCWNPIIGAPNPADQIVTFSLRLNRDGTIASWQLLTLNGNNYTTAAAEAASRAAYACQPYDMLPAARYNEWREFQLRFDPRQMQ